MLKIFRTVWQNGERKPFYAQRNYILSEKNLSSRVEIYDLNTFEGAYDFFNKHFTSSYFATYSLFDKPVIQKPNGKYITVKNFEPFKIIKTYEDITDRTTIKELAENLKADEFCRFLRDRQVNFDLELTK